MATVLVAPLAMTRIMRRRPRHRALRRRSAVSAGLVLVLAVVSLCNGIAWSRELTGANNELAGLLTWMRSQVPVGERVAYAEGVIQFALQSEGYQAVPLGSPQAMARAGVRYFVVIPREVEQHYTFVSVAAYDFYRAHSTVVFGSSNAAGREIQVFKTTDPSVW
jgi:hypothetical protein